MKKALLISCFDWYDNRLAYVSKYLKDKGYNVTTLTSDFDHIQKKYVEKKKNEVKYIHVRNYKKNISFTRCISHIEFSKKVAHFISQDIPNLIWCLIPPNSLAKELSRLKKHYGFYLIYDLIDLWPESFPHGNKHFFLFDKWRLLRDSNLNIADKLIVECDYYKETINKVVDQQKIGTFRLVKKEIASCTTCEPLSQDVCLCYLGSINSIVDISRIESIVREICSKYTVGVRIIGDGERRKELISALKACGAEVIYYGKIFDENQKKRLMCNCHFGINIYKDNINVGLTMKSVDYFQMNLPILNSIPGDTTKLVNIYSAGINVRDFSLDSLSAIINQIDVFRNNVRELFLNEFSDRNCMDRIDNILQFGCGG